MKDLKEYIKEGLFDDINKLEGKSGLESNYKQLKKEIIDWISNNYYSSYPRRNSHKLKKRNIEVDMTTTPPTVDYDGDLYADKDIISLNNNDLFQWGKMGGDFDCTYCTNLKSLEGAPKEVGYDFSCAHCKSLKSLEGAPEEVGGSFSCNDCHSLKNLEGAPKKVVRGFYCNYCKSLTTLEGAPEEVGRDFNCTDCDSLTSLKGAPKEVGGDFDCRYCETEFTEEDINKVSEVKGKILC